MNTHSVPQATDTRPNTTATVRPPRTGRKSLVLAGAPRNQEANRKRIVHALRSIESESLRTARRAGKIAEAWAVCDVATIALNRVQTRRLLEDALRLDDENVVWDIRRLLGIDSKVLDSEAAAVKEKYGWLSLQRAAGIVLEYHIRGERNLHAAHAPSTQPPDPHAVSQVDLLRSKSHRVQKALREQLAKAGSDSKVAAAIRKLLSETADIDSEIDKIAADCGMERPSNPNAASSAVAALDEAKRIVAKLGDLHVEQIDWTQEPGSERERALRKAIIRRIEAEGARASCSSPYPVLNRLRSLVDSPLFDDEDPIGSDLGEAIERWDQRCDEYEADRRKNEHRRLLKDARRELDGNPPEAA
jgi:hypothetical protein